MFTALFITGAVMAFIYGIVVGSFLNVCIYRLPRGESLLAPPSHCPSCQQRLRPIDLVPLFSFLALRGRCRYCHTRISWRYFTIEFITGLLFLAVWFSLALNRFGDIMWTLPGLVLLASAWLFAAAMLVTFVIDLETTYVIEPVTWLAMAAGLVFEVTAKWVNVEPLGFSIGHLYVPYVPAAVPGMIIGFLVFQVMDLFGRLIFRKPGMGLGDSFIGAAVGAMLGPGLAMVSFSMAIFGGAIIGLLLMAVGALRPSRAPVEEDVASRPPALEDEEDEVPQGAYMPFGPFLTASAMVVVLAPEWFGRTVQTLIHWWLYQNPFMS